MNVTQAIASGFIKYFTFSGRASRSEYWYWVSFLMLGRFVARILDAVIFPSSTLVIAPRALESLLLLILLIPTFAVAVRRLHDVDRSGWWLLMYFTIIGIFFPLLIWKLPKGTYG